MQIAAFGCLLLGAIELIPAFLACSTYMPVYSSYPFFVGLVLRFPFVQKEVVNKTGAAKVL